MKLATKIKLIFVTVLTFIAVLAAGLVVSTKGTTAYAEGETSGVTVSLEVQGLSDRASNKRGDVVYNVMIANNSGKGIVGCDFDITFDSTVFSVKSVTSNVAGWNYEYNVISEGCVRGSGMSLALNDVPASTKKFQVATVTFGRNAQKPTEQDYSFALSNVYLTNSNFDDFPEVSTPAATFEYRAPHTNTSIGEVTVGGEVVTAGADGKYHVNYLYHTDSTEVEATVGDIDRGHALATIAGTGTKALEVGDNKVVLTVTAEDEVTTQDYEVIINRGAASTDHTLSEFTLNGEAVTAGEDGVYRKTLPFNTDLATMTATAAFPHASVVKIGYAPEPVDPEAPAEGEGEVSGEEGGEGEATEEVTPPAEEESSGIGEPMLVKVGENKFHVSVLAEDGNVYPVEVIITREEPDVKSALSWLRFNGEYANSALGEDGKYRINEPFTTRTAKFNAEADVSLATHEHSVVVGVVPVNPVEDEVPDIDKPVSNGINTTFNLAQGENVFNVIVRYRGENNLEEDGFDYNVEVIVTREFASSDKELEYLKFNDEEITPDSEGKYNVGDVEYGVYTAKIEAVAANANAHVSQITCGALTVAGGIIEKLTLATGENLIKIEVTAEDGSTKEHEVTLNRLPGNPEYIKIAFEFDEKQLAKFEENPNFYIGESDIAEDNGEPIIRNIKAPKKFIDFSLSVPDHVTVDVLFFFGESVENVTDNVTSDVGSVTTLAKVVKPTVSDGKLNFHIEALDGGSNTLLLRLSDKLSGMSKLCIIDIERPIKGGVSAAALVFLIIFLLNMLVIAVLFILDSRNKVEVDENTYKIIVENGGTAPVIIDPSYTPTSSGKDEKKDKKGKKGKKEDDIELEGANDNKSKNMADKIKMLNKVKKAKEDEKDDKAEQQASSNDIQSKLDALKKKKTETAVEEKPAEEEPKKEKKSLFGKKNKEEAPVAPAEEEPKKALTPQEKAALLAKKKASAKEEPAKAEPVKEEPQEEPKKALTPQEKAALLAKKKASAKEEPAKAEPVKEEPQEEPKKEKKSLFGKKNKEEAPVAPAEEEPKKALTPQEKAALLSKKKVSAKPEPVKEEPKEEPKEERKKALTPQEKAALLSKKAPAKAEPKAEPVKAEPVKEEPKEERKKPLTPQEKAALLAKKAPAKAEPKEKPVKAEPKEEPKNERKKPLTPQEKAALLSKKADDKKASNAQTNELLTEIRDLLANQNGSDNGGKKKK